MVTREFVAGRCLYQHRDGSYHVNCPHAPRREPPRRRITLRQRPRGVEPIGRGDSDLDLSMAWLATRAPPRDLEAKLRDDPDALDAVDAHGWTPLHHAAGGGCHNHVGVILDCLKATPSDDDDVVANFVNKQESLSGWTAVHVAVIGMHAAVLRLLLDNGGRLDVEDVYGTTPVDVRPRLGISDRASEICRILADDGVKVEVQHQLSNEA